MPRGFHLLRQANAEIYAPLRTVRERAAHDFSWRFWDVLARVKPGVTFRQAQAAMTVFSQRRETEDPAPNRGIVARLEPLHERLFGAYRAPFRCSSAPPDCCS